MNKKDPSQVLYHKFIIKGFVSCAEWGQHPSLLKTLKDTRGLTELQYSYYDYMDAFEKILFYQNQDFDHSWFMMFDRSFKGPIPTWFLKWWEMFGLIPQILLEPLQDALRYFSSKFPVSTHGSQFPAILHMTVMYRIHWISKWDYALKPNLLDREFSIKCCKPREANNNNDGGGGLVPIEVISTGFGADNSGVNIGVEGNGSDKNTYKTM
nr:hypothetical protein CFP56_54135 [Quercus suber]